MASQLYAAIHEWHSGVHVATDFSSDMFMDVYNGHILSLERIKYERPRAFHLMMAELYNLARYVAACQ